jgi:hypothetical protein
MRRTTKARALFHCRGWRVVHGEGERLSAPRLTIRSSAEEPVVRVGRARAQYTIDDEPWPTDPVELFHFLSGGRR